MLVKRFHHRDHQPAHRADSIQGTDYTVNDYIVLLLEFKGFENENSKSKTTNQKKHLSCNRQKICNIVVPET